MVVTYWLFDRTGGVVMFEGSLGQVWRETRGLANCGIARADGTVIARRRSNWPWEIGETTSGS